MSLATLHKEKWPLLVFIVLLPIFTFISKTTADVYLTLTGLFFVFYSVKNKEYDWLQWPWVRAIFAFILVAMISACFSIFPKEAFIQSFIYLRWPLAAIALVSLVFTNQQRLHLFEKTAFFFLLFIIVDTVFQFFYGKDILGHPIGGTSRLTGPFTKTLVGAYSLKLFFFAFVFLYMLVEKNTKNLFLLTLSILAFNVFLLITGERIVFIFGVLFLLGWLLATAFIYQALRKFIPLILMGGAALFALIVVFARDLLLLRFVPFIDAIKNFSSTTYGDIFHSAFELWQLSPLLGVGMRMYSEVCVAKLGYTENEVLFEQTAGLCVRHPHNIYLEILAQNGIVGLLLFVLTLYCIFRVVSAKRIWQQDSLLAVILTGSVVVTFWPLATSMSIFANNYAGAVWLTIAWAIARAQHIPAKIIN
ncbi:MAG: O-antigen ligase family protein [Moraxellaceae bacterium]|nr:O-antigen ligase family protein [Moraxellaceae bacterium]